MEYMLQGRKTIRNQFNNNYNNAVYRESPRYLDLVNCQQVGVIYLKFQCPCRNCFWVKQKRKTSFSAIGQVSINDINADKKEEI